MKAYQWIDQVKTALNLQSDYAAAKALRIRPSAISNYRAKLSTLDEETALSIAKALHVSAAGIVLDQAAERSKNPELRSTLSAEARKLCILC